MCSLVQVTGCRAYHETDSRWLCRRQISKKYTHYAAILLFFFFGGRSLWEAYSSSGGVSA